MSNSVAVVAYAFLILTVFLLNRDRGSRVSPGLWIPVAWLSICASRSVAQWLGGVDPDVPLETVFVEGNPLDALVFAYFDLLANDVGMDRQLASTPVDKNSERD